MGGTAQALQGFVEGYVRAVPELLDSVAEMARRTGRSAALAPLLCAASQFFVRPLALMQGSRCSPNCSTKPTWPIGWSKS